MHKIPASLADSFKHDHDEPAPQFHTSLRILFLTAAGIGVIAGCVFLFAQFRTGILALMKETEPSRQVQLTPEPHTATPSSTPNTPTPHSTDVLGKSDLSFRDAYGNDLLSTPTPFPTLAPLPTSTPYPTTAPVYTYTPPAPSVPSCAGTPTAYNSQAYVSASTVLVNATATIDIELLDCNNTVAPVSDTLKITLANTDSGNRINGNTAPVTVTTLNGKATISVSSSNTGVDTYVITDETRGFTVTDPHNRNPTISVVNNLSGNSSCTTPANEPNAWYSDVYPNPPVTTTTGSVTLVVDIRDCNKNLAPVSDSIRISLSSGDPNTKINGNSLPYSVTTQNGEVSFSVSSQTTGTVTLVVTDTTAGFTVTNTNNSNPSISFGSPQASATPTPTQTQSQPTPTPTTGVSATPTPTGTSAPTPTPTGSAPTATPTPTPA